MLQIWAFRYFWPIRDVEETRQAERHAAVVALAQQAKRDPEPVLTCQWPLWPDRCPPGRPLFCEAPVLVRGCAYCALHAVMAFARPTDPGL